MGLRTASERLPVSSKRLNAPMPLPLIRDAEVIRRFMKLVRQDRGVWEWIGAKDRKGYGRFKYEGHAIAAHRVAYAIFNGPIESDYYIHHIDPEGGPSNVNPDNLQKTTILENTYARFDSRSEPDDIPI